MHAFIYTYISTKFINYFNRNWNYIFESLEKFKATSNLKRVYDLKFRKYYTHTHTLSLSLSHTYQNKINMKKFNQLYFITNFV